jgi:hypothetical protein
VLHVYDLFSLTAPLATPALPAPPLLRPESQPPPPLLVQHLGALLQPGDGDAVADA